MALVLGLKVGTRDSSPRLCPRAKERLAATAYSSAAECPYLLPGLGYISLKHRYLIFPTTPICTLEKNRTLLRHSYVFCATIRGELDSCNE